MSMNATDVACSACATFRATVDFPEPDPPAMPMISGFASDVSRTGRSTRVGRSRVDVGKRSARTVTVLYRQRVRVRLRRKRRLGGGSCVAIEASLPSRAGSSIAAGAAGFCPRLP